MIDEAFMPLREMVDRLLSFRGEFVDREAGVRTYIHECELESPVELDVVRDAEGRLGIGSIPPLYDVDTSIRPSLHRLRLTARLSEDSDGQ